MTAPQAIIDLVEKFDQNKQGFLSKEFNETQVRSQFVNPFFEALGWDVRNKQNPSRPDLCEVKEEDSVYVDGKKKRPDYGFRISGKRKFFVEVKQPSKNIDSSIDFAFQIKRYAWNAHLPISILTDFEEFAVYYCGSRPSESDRSDKSRLLSLRYDQYVEKWSEISDLFSREAVLNGSIDKYVKSIPHKRGEKEVDDSLLDDISEWREMLAKNIALRNPELSTSSLNYAVQTIIDRIMFLRICEDRGIEQYMRLKDLLNGDRVYLRLFEMFQQADERYNSGIFHFNKEPGRSNPDTITPKLIIDDKPLKDIIKQLYFPVSPYEFSVLPAEILGQIYEQFLGKVIRLTAGHRAKVEYKPQVKKAGGVKYTPAYIVECIVKETIGSLVKGKTSDEVDHIHILDPACGSGSFLIVAYQYLLDWYKEWYIQNQVSVSNKKKKSKETIYKGKDGEWKLTTEERKRILINNIYGVDIDSQAVEVTKLSLLLKVLEGENEETLSKQMKIFHERVLPDLSNNIKCGNSLINWDILKDNPNLAKDEVERINPFDWESGFPEIMQAGGFHAIIGNPPYIRIQTMKEWAPLEVERYKQEYVSASSGNYDIYVIFVEKGLSLLNDQGRLGFILPHKFFNAKYGQPLRMIISNGRHLSKVVHFGDQQVFDGVTTYTCLLFLNKSGKDKLQFVKVQDLEEWRITTESTEGEIDSENIKDDVWNFVVGRGAELFEKLNAMQVKLSDATVRIFQGIKTGADKIYIVEEIERIDDKVKVYSKENMTEYWIEIDLLHPLIKGGDSKRYHFTKTNRLILFPYVSVSGTVNLISESHLKSKYPLTWSYLQDNKEYLENREHGKMSGTDWYSYSRNQALDVISLPKIFTPDIAAHSSLSFDECGDVFFTGGVAGGYGILVSPEFSTKYMLGLLNSKLLEWFIHQSATSMRGGYYSYESRFIRNLPIRTIDFSDPQDAARQDQMVNLVESILDLHKQIQEVHTPHEKTLIQSQIEYTDGQIDELVYKLYDLTEEEIKIVEGITK